MQAAKQLKQAAPLTLLRCAVEPASAAHHSNPGNTQAGVDPASPATQAASCSSVMLPHSQPLAETSAMAVDSLTSDALSTHADSASATVQDQDQCAASPILDAYHGCASAYTAKHIDSRASGGQGAGEAQHAAGANCQGALHMQQTGSGCGKLPRPSSWQRRKAARLRCAQQQEQQAGKTASRHSFVHHHCICCRQT